MAGVLILLVPLLLAGPWTGLVFGFLSADIIVTNLDLALNTSQYIVLGSVLCAVPIAGYLAGILVQPLLGERQDSRVFCVAGATLALALAARGDNLVQYLDSVISMVNASSLSEQLLLFGACARSVVLCAGLVAASLFVMVLAFELPLWWVQGIAGGKIELAIAGCRPVLVLLALSVVLHAVVSLCAYQFETETLLRSAGL